jgi:hypothetical protein
VRLGAIAAHRLKGQQRGFVDVRAGQHHLIGSSDTSGQVGQHFAAVAFDVRACHQAVPQKRVGFVDEQNGATALLWRDFTAAAYVAAIGHGDKAFVVGQQVRNLP